MMLRRELLSGAVWGRIDRDVVVLLQMLRFARGTPHYSRQGVPATCRGLVKASSGLITGN